MSNKVDKNEVYAAISAQRALFGIITPNLRAVTIDLIPKKWSTDI